VGAKMLCERATKHLDGVFREWMRVCRQGFAVPSAASGVTGRREKNSMKERAKTCQLLIGLNGALSRASPAKSARVGAAGNQDASEDPI
jgi:hypothetical protein